MTRKIESKILSFSVVKPQDAAALAASEEAARVAALPPVLEPTATEMNEHIARSDALSGRTYKISKSPASEHALYVTINDIILDEGTQFERRRPFEIFINSKNMDQFQWVVAMTRIISAVFRKGGDVTFLVEEMKSVFDPHGGYFRPGGFVPSLVAEIGQIIERHLQATGVMATTELDPAQRALIAEKRAKFEEKSASSAASSAADASENSFPPNATLCNKCMQKSVIIMDGCATCLNCGNSKCG